jgi:hypothetical protein
MADDIIEFPGKSKPTSGSPPACLPLPVQHDIEQHRRALEPASREQAAVAIAPLLAVFGAPTGWEHGGAAAYLEALDDLPFAMLKQAVAAHIRSSKWFPKPVELRELCQEDLAYRREELGRAIRFSPPDPEAMRRAAEANERRFREAAEAREAIGYHPLQPLRLAEDLLDRPARPIAEVEAELRWFRLPDPDHPRVVEIMRKMGE